jgi:hypothetical protein
MDAALLAFVMRALALAIGLVLVAGAVEKLRDLGGFRAAVAEYRLLPQALTGAFALALPLAEALAGVALLVEPARLAGAWLGAGVVAIATLGVAINVMRGRVDIDCGCGGVEGRQRLSWALVARNGVLCALLAASAQVAAPAPRGLVAGTTLVVAAVAFFALFAAASQLAANRPLLRELAGRS